VDSKNPSRSEGGDVEQVARTSTQISCICDCPVSHSCFYSYCSIYAHTYSLHSYNHIMFV